MTTPSPALESAPPSGGGRFPGYGEESPLDLSELGPAVAAGLAARFRDGRMDRFSDALASVRHCARPVRLHGSSVHRRPDHRGGPVEL